jgi:hypothetical protein
MAAVLEECNTEEQRSIVLFFCGQKESMQRIFMKKPATCFLLHAGFLLGLFSEHEDGGHIFLRIVS